jgi:uncharacterized protein YodC (DUF2158 family)
MNFKAGDVVMLKSGGPLMTIQTIEEKNGEMTAWCQWFEGSKTAANRFTLTSLKPAEK